MAKLHWEQAHSIFEIGVNKQQIGMTAKNLSACLEIK
jgi:hypothetical protein